MQEQQDERHTHDRQAERQFGDIKVIDSAQLFADRREVRIRHRGECYRLLLTKNGRLILNK
jgi:hemin uptake protein HemP